METQATAPDIARRAFDAVAAVRKVSTPQALEVSVGRELRALGYDMIAGYRTQRRTGAQQVDVLFGDMQHRWVRHYVEAQLGANCPVARQTSLRPAFFSELRVRPHTDSERTVFEHLDEFALHEGHCVAVEHDLAGVVGVCVAGPHVDSRDPYVAAATHLLSVHFGLAGLKLWQKAQGVQADDPALSDRQIECLKWVRDGKSSADIGAILGISARTVDEHVERACRRLAVKTRIQAVAEAALLGLMEL